MGIVSAPPQVGPFGSAPVQKHASSNGLGVGAESRDAEQLSSRSEFPRGESRSVWPPAMELLGYRGLGLPWTRGGRCWGACGPPAWTKVRPPCTETLHRDRTGLRGSLPTVGHVRSSPFRPGGSVLTPFHHGVQAGVGDPGGPCVGGGGSHDAVRPPPQLLQGPGHHLAFL